MSAAPYAIRCATGCQSLSKMRANMKSRISPARCVFSAFCLRNGRPVSSARKTPPRPEKPSLVVLPFQHMGSDAEIDFFLDSVGEDLITELARARWFSVVARNTSFTYKGKNADSKQVARELGVRYVIEGSLRKSGSRVRISCQLVDAASGQNLWSDRFDGTFEDSFELQDKIVESVIGSVEPVLRLAEIERARRKTRGGT